MPILLLSLLFALNSFACDFSKEVKGVYSLSGVTTLLLKDLGLLKNPRLKAISVFHPVSPKEFPGEFLPGGVFLSHDSVKKLNGSVVFYDESRELTKILSRYPGIKAVEVKTRSLTPIEVIRKFSDLNSYFNNCPLKDQVSKIQQSLIELRSLIVGKPKVLFFLGSFQFGKSPEMLMVQDGVVKWMIEEKLIQTYPSELAYVNWSSKIMNELAGYKKIGIKDSGKEMKRKIEKSGEGLNLTYPGSLIPGFGQVEAMIYLFKNI